MSFLPKTNAILVATFIFFSLILPSNALAITVTFSNLSSTINTDQEITVNVGLECQSCGDSYLRGVFYEDGTNYFGLTQNNFNEWIGTSEDKTRYYKVDNTSFIEATWSGQIKIKVQSDDPKYNGPKNYFFKVGRYTQSGSATWSSESQIFINGPTPTPASTSTPIPTSTPTLTPSPTSTPVPTKIPTPTLIAKVKTTPKPIVESQNSESKVLAAREELKPTVTPTTKPDGGNQKSFPLVAGVLMVAGVVFVGLASFPFIKMRLKGYNEKHGPGKVEQ